jgi:hypothetical protein
MRKLSTGEWRLFLLSDCIRRYPDIAEQTDILRVSGKEVILQITKEDSDYLNELVSEEDIPLIREQLLKEWKFSKQVKDNGRGNKSTCEYCQHQQIRYRYLCVNEKTRVWLSLGSVCVGNVIYGEERMKDKDFASEFVSQLEGMKGKSTPENRGQINIEERRQQQAPVIKACVQFLRFNCGYQKSEFLDNLQRQWSEGRPLTDKQLMALRNWASKEKNKRLGEAK